VLASGRNIGFILDLSDFWLLSDVIPHPFGDPIMSFLLMQSPLQNFTNLIITYFIEIWDFLIFIGQISGIIIVLIGAILWFTETNQGRGKGLVFSGVMLSIVIEYFVLFPPSFVLT
jgi:hypothetical protein